MGRAEAHVEKYLVRRVEEMGGITRKVVYQGRKGSPDRWCFLPHGRLLIIECKSDVGKLSPGQVLEIDRLKQMGQQVHVVSTREEVDEALSTWVI